MRRLYVDIALIATLLINVVVQLSNNRNVFAFVDLVIAVIYAAAAVWYVRRSHEG